MKQYSSQFTDLPLEIITNILSRLPVRNVVCLKNVSKLWLELLESPEFAKLHLPKSSPGLLVHHLLWELHLFNLFRFEDVLNYIPVAKFDTKKFHGSKIVDSVDGFLCLRAKRPVDALYICNPITREYISLPTLEWVSWFPCTVTYGFGVSTNGDQYKVVLNFHMTELDTARNIPRSDTHVYTLGTTGMWRSIEPSPPLHDNCFSTGAFLNGHLHWLVGDLQDSRVISCLDLDNEKFSTFPGPPLPGYRSRCLARLTVLKDHLSVSDNTSESDIVIWMMKDYGAEKSWTKEFIISKIPGSLAGACYDLVSPIKVFKNGDILMAWGDYHLFYYSNRDKNTSRIDTFELDYCAAVEAVLHVPALVSLTCFARENVNSF